MTSSQIARRNKAMTRRMRSMIFSMTRIITKTTINLFVPRRLKARQEKIVLVKDWQV